MSKVQGFPLANPRPSLSEVKKRVRDGPKNAPHQRLASKKNASYELVIGETILKLVVQCGKCQVNWHKQNVPLTDRHLATPRIALGLWLSTSEETRNVKHYVGVLAGGLYSRPRRVWTARASAFATSYIRRSVDEGINDNAYYLASTTHSVSAVDGSQVCTPTLSGNAKSTARPVASQTGIY